VASLVSPAACFELALAITPAASELAIAVPDPTEFRLITPFETPAAGVKCYVGFLLSTFLIVQTEGNVLTGC
jgi:hypothetical protein